MTAGGEKAAAALAAVTGKQRPLPTHGPAREQRARTRPWRPQSVHSKAAGRELLRDFSGGQHRKRATQRVPCIAGVTGTMICCKLYQAWAFRTFDGSDARACSGTPARQQARACPLGFTPCVQGRGEEPRAGAARRPHVAPLSHR